MFRPTKIQIKPSLTAPPEVREFTLYFHVLTPGPSNWTSTFAFCHIYSCRLDHNPSLPLHLPHSCERDCFILPASARKYFVSEFGPHFLKGRARRDPPVQSFPVCPIPPLYFFLCRSVPASSHHVHATTGTVYTTYRLTPPTFNPQHASR